MQAFISIPNHAVSNNDLLVIHPSPEIKAHDAASHSLPCGLLAPTPRGPAAVASWAGVSRIRLRARARSDRVRFLVSLTAFPFISGGSFLVLNGIGDVLKCSTSPPWVGRSGSCRAAFQLPGRLNTVGNPFACCWVVRHFNTHGVPVVCGGI